MRFGLNYLWRVAATGFSFASFGIGGLLLGSTAFPLIRIFSARETRCARIRWLIHKSFGAFVRMMELLGIMHLEVRGAGKLRHCNKALVLANHPTLIDVVVLISLMPAASCIVKRALWRNFFLRGVVRAADYISNSEAETLIADCADDLERGNPLLIFPEGTRTGADRALHFQRGAAYIALRGDTAILPVLIYCDPPTLGKTQRWYQIPARPFHIRVLVQNELSLDNWKLSEKTPSLAARRLTKNFEQYFTEELAANA
jgi:1-acyl-sn-glycerol-3-phosphate acyltransferase